MFTAGATRWKHWRKHWHKQTCPTPQLIDPQKLASYAGRYELEENGAIVATITFQVEGQRLVAYKDGVWDFSMIAETETRFLAVEFDASVTFNVEGNRVTGFLIDQAQAQDDYLFKKVAP